MRAPGGKGRDTFQRSRRGHSDRGGSSWALKRKLKKKKKRKLYSTRVEGLRRAPPTGRFPTGFPHRSHGFPIFLFHASPVPPYPPRITRFRACIDVARVCTVRPAPGFRVCVYNLETPLTGLMPFVDDVFIVRGSREAASRRAS